MKRILAVIALAVVMSASAYAVTVPCDLTGLTLDQLLAGGQYSGCVVQDKTFSNFVFLSAAVSPADVAVGAFPDAGYPGAPHVDIGIGFSGVFGVGPGGMLDINISYLVTVTDPNYLIDDAGLFLSGVNFLGGNGFIQGAEDWCAGGLLIGGCVGGQHVTQGIAYSLAGGTDTYHVDFSPSVTFVDVTKDIEVHGGTETGVAFSRIEQDYSQETGIPEPVSMILLGSGLGLIGLVGRKLRKA